MTTPQIVNGDGIRHPRMSRAPKRMPGDPSERWLAIYALDASCSRYDGAVAWLKLPYEALAPGAGGRAVQGDSDTGGGV